MKISNSSLISMLLAVLFLISITGCGIDSLRFWESESVADAVPEEFSILTTEVKKLSQDESAVFPIVEQPQDDNIFVIDIAGLSQDVSWRLQAINWLSWDKLAVVVADGVRNVSNNVIMTKAVMFDWKAQEESLVITLPDAIVNRVVQEENALYLYDTTTIYTVNSQDFSLIGTSPNASSSAPFGSLLLRRDDKGVVLEDITGKNNNIRVARNDENGIYGKQMLWSPNGQLFLITKQSLTDQSGNAILIGNRDGEFLREIDMYGVIISSEDDELPSHYDFAPYWSSDGSSVLVADSISLRNYSMFSGAMLNRLRISLYNSAIDVLDIYGDRVVLCKPATNGWVTVLANLSSGESVELLETPMAVSAKFSPDGNRIVAVEKGNANQLYLIKL